MRRLAADHRRLLGNGHCTGPAALDCNFETICERCGFFDTGPQFIPILRPNATTPSNATNTTAPASSTVSSTASTTNRPTCSNDPAHDFRITRVTTLQGHRLVCDRNAGSERLRPPNHASVMCPDERLGSGRGPPMTRAPILAATRGGWCGCRASSREHRAKCTKPPTLGAGGCGAGGSDDRPTATPPRRSGTGW